MKLIISALFITLSINSFAADRLIKVVNHQYEGTKQWVPGTIVVNKGDTVTIQLTNNTPSGVHNFSIPEFKVNVNVLKGKPQEVKLTADKKGIFTIKCGLHKAHVGGQFVVL